MKKLEEKILAAAKKYEGLPVALSGGVDSSLLAALIKPKFAISVDLPGKHGEIQYAKSVAEFLGIKHEIVTLDESKFDEYTKEAVKAIGRPIPHFNIFPLYCMYKRLHELGETAVVLGDGPDETMCGYARDLIIHYLYKIYDYPAFEDYHGLIDKILPPEDKAVLLLTGKSVKGKGSAIESMIKVNIEEMRPDMDDMSNGIAEHFGIKNRRPYQDDAELDNFMRDLPIEKKIQHIEYGKCALRKVAEKYLPYDIAWRKIKVGGPVYPVNKLKGWELIEGEFGKQSWLDYQRNILDAERDLNVL